MPDLPPILIAGGGIGRLAAPCGPGRRIRRSIIVGQAARPGGIGAGKQIGPNAFHCFDSLGVGGEARAKAARIDGPRLMDGQVAGDITCRSGTPSARMPGIISILSHSVELTPGDPIITGPRA